VGAQLVGAEVGGNVFAEPKKAYFLLNAEVQFDCHNAGQALAAVEAADFVVALNPFVDGVEDYADVILPIAPFSETAGTYINMEGRAQSFHGATRPLGEARPAWKVLRVLGNLFGFGGFEYESAEAIRDEALAGELAPRLDNTLLAPQPVKARSAAGLVRLGEVGIYQLDALTRRAPALQATAAAAQPCVRANATTLAALELRNGQAASVEQDGGKVLLNVQEDPSLPDQVIHVAAGHALTTGLGGLFAAIAVGRAG
jgi:NADH-quinone oxidoreductase subunit G